MASDSGEPDGAGAAPLLEPRESIPPIVSDAQSLKEATAALAAGRGPVAVDAERASGYRYGQRAYLVQFRRHGSGTILIDPISCPDLSGVDAALADTEAVLHAASQDLPCLAEVSYKPRRIFDTELAGRLLGFPRVGLATLVEEILGVRLEKGHSAADWSTRPLPASWIRYAVLDVEVLVELRDSLAAQLDAAGKSEWACQEFRAVLEAVPARPRADPWRRTSGIHRVRSPRGLAAVRELWQARDGIARRLDLSPGRVLPDAAIVEAARTLPVTSSDLHAIGGFTGRNARRYTGTWLRALARARSGGADSLPEPSVPGDGPPPASRWAERDPAAARRLEAARTVVAAIADEHSVPSENLLQPDTVRRLCWNPPAAPTLEAIQGELAHYGARPWQIELTALPLAGALRRLHDKGEG
ncbi:MAG: HRDC domain-containing protein [Micromonosporaceae bacterium]